MVLKLMYRVKRVFFGESGIVEKVEPLNDERVIEDDYGNYPTDITFRIWGDKFP